MKTIGVQRRVSLAVVAAVLLLPLSPRPRSHHTGKEPPMKPTGVQSRVSLAVVAAVLLLQLSPRLAAGQPDAQAISQEPLEVTFTKWGTTGTFLAGNAGGDVAGR